MRVVLCAVLAVVLMTATAIADTAAKGLRQEVAGAPTTAAPATPPPHFLPRPSQLMQAVGNYFHQHHQDTAAAHHASHAQHHVDAHGATPPAQLAPAAGAAAPADASYTQPGPQPPHTQNQQSQSHLGTHLQQAGLVGPGEGNRPLGGLFGNHHNNQHHPELPRPVIATRTAFVEVTKRVTRHPVCMTVYGERPPCLPYNEYRPSPYKKPAADYRNAERNQHSEHSYRMEAEDDMDYNDMGDGYYINPTQVVRMGPATAAADSMFMRSARYITIGSPSPVSPGPAATFSEPTKSDDAAVATPALETAMSEGFPSEEQRQGEPGAGGPFSQLASTFGNMLPNLPVPPMMGQMGPSKHTPETRYEIKTLWVTKVERFTDYRVTATLVAENCVPTDSKIPFCNTGYAGPTYEAAEDYAHPYTEKPHIITTPKPPKKPGYGSGPPHRPLSILHRPRPTPPPPTPAPYKPPPTPYTPAPAPYAPTPAPYTPAPAAYGPAPEQYPAPAQQYPPNYAPNPEPPPNYPAPNYTPPPASAEPTYDYPRDGPTDQHWVETDQSQADEIAMEAEQESA